MNFQGLRTGGIAGIIFVVGVVGINFIVPPPPEASDAPAKYLKYLADNRTALMIQSSVFALLIIPLLVFIPLFRQYVSSFEPAGGVAGRATEIGFVVAWAGIALLSTLYGGLAYLANSTLDEVQARNLYLLTNIAYYGVMAAWAGAALFSGLALLNGKGAVRLVGGLGVLSAIISAISVFAWADDGLFAPGFSTFLSYLVLMLYLLAVSILMVRATPAGEPARGRQGAKA